MPEVGPHFKFQPCLLDRLRDDEPDKKEESSSQRVIPYSRYRDGVLRDLRWLLNTNALVSGIHDEQDLTRYPLICESVLNFGVRSLSGQSVAGIDKHTLVAQIVEAFARFEPRIDPRTLDVKFISGENEIHLVGFEVSGELFADPVPQHLVFKTKLDVETGHIAGDRLDGS